MSRCTRFAVAVLFVALAGVLPIFNPILSAQTDTTAPSFRQSVVLEEMKADPFRAALIKAIPAAVQDKHITRAEGMRLRVAMFSPAFARAAKELALTQMAASGSENVPYTEAGTIDEAAINWEGLTEFLKVLLPILLELLKGLGAI